MEYMIKCYGVKQILGKCIIETLRMGNTKVFPKKHRSSELIVNKNLNVIAYVNGAGGSGVLVYVDEYGGEVCSRQRITGECLKQEKSAEYLRN